MGSWAIPGGRADLAGVPAAELGPHLSPRRRVGADARSGVRNPNDPARVLLVNYDGDTDHFAGVERALAARGVGGCTRYTLRDVGEPFPESARVVVVKDTRTYLSLFALRQARRVGAVTVLVMDGIVEYRNTYLNPRAGPDFLRPTPVDVVACAGETDRRLLEAFGNHAVATGLPRLAAAFPAPLPPPSTGAVLVATANQPCFCDHERPRLVRSLTRLRAVLEARGVPVIWRLTGGLDADLGLQSDNSSKIPLREALAQAAAVVTTPSTLMVEAMLAGRPTALLHPHPTPCWQPATWVWRGGEVPEIDLATGLDPASIPIADAAELVERILGPCPAEWDRHHAGLARLHQNDPAPADALAALIAEQIESPRRARHGVKVPSVERLPSPLPSPAPDRPRLVACLRLDSTAPSDLLSRVRRFGEFSAGAGATGFELHILAVVTEPDPWDPHRNELGADGRTHACVIDPLADTWRIVETVRAALERLQPAAILAQADDLCLVAAEHLRTAGGDRPAARVIPMVAGDGDRVRSLLAQYDRWDGALALDEAAQAWLSASAAGRPVASEAEAALLFARALARPADAVPSDRGFSVDSTSAWGRTWSEDPDAAERWIRDRLVAAGFRSVALGRPTPGCDAVILSPRHHRPGPGDITEWRRRGLVIVAAPHLRTRLILRLHDLLAAAVADGASRIAIFGTGAHTRRARDVLDLGIPIVGFIDDAPPPGGTLWGLPVVPLAGAIERLAPDAVLLSSDAWEEVMWRRCEPLRRAGVRVIPVYGRYDEPAPQHHECTIEAATP